MSTVVRYVRRGSHFKGGDRRDHRAWSGLVHKVFEKDIAPTPWTKKKRVKQLTLAEFIKIRTRETSTELLWLNDRCIYDQNEGTLTEVT